MLSNFYVNVTLNLPPGHHVTMLQESRLLRADVLVPGSPELTSLLSGHSGESRHKVSHSDS